MIPVLPDVAGADLLSAPATLPDEQEHLDDELVDLLCRDQAWVDEAFAEIVATSWDEPPPGGSAHEAARPRRFARPGRRRRCRGSAVGSQWCPRPNCRQRSPPSS